MRLTITTLILSLLSMSCKAQFFKALTDAVGSVASASVKLATAPTEAVINTARAVTGNAPASSIYQPFQEAAKSAGAALPQTYQVLNQPQEFMMGKAQELAGLGGDPGAFIFDVGTFSQRYYSQLAAAGVNNFGGILQGQNPFQLAAAPLAAAIRAAHEQYKPSAQPLPDEVKQYFKGRLDDALLQRARYTVGRIEITLPNFIGKGNKLMGNDAYAVTVDDIIVFNAQPPTAANAAFWWAHELTHVRQYGDMGIEKFAFEYMRDLGHSLEGDADNNAGQITGQRTSSARLVAGSFDMSGQPQPAPTTFQQNPELYVAQCIFPNDAFGAMYLVTNYGRIIAVDPRNGGWMHIGYCSAPLLPNVTWTYDLPNANYKYAVMANGNILTARKVLNAWGYYQDEWIAIGYVVKL